MRKVATLHARLTPETNPEIALVDIKIRLGSQFGIGHATVQIETGVCSDATPDHTHAHV